MNQDSAESVERPYGWVIVGAAALMLAMGVGMVGNSVSVFLKPLTSEFGWERGDVSLIYFAAVMGLGLGGIIMGRLADRTSTRRVVMFGVVSLGVCFVAVSQASSLWLFLLLFFLAGLFGAGSLFAPLLANVGNWFDRNMGLALGITSAGQAFGQGAVPYLAAYLIGDFGWRGALYIMGFMALGLLFPLTLLIRQPPVVAARDAAAANQAAPELDESPVPLAPNTVVTWLSVGVVLCCICMSVPLMHLVPLVQDRGISLEDAAGVLFAVLLAGIFGRIAFGKLADHIGSLRSYMLASAWQTALVFVFTQLETLDTFLWFAPLYGFGYSGVMTGIMVSVRSMTPFSRRAMSLGVVTMFGWTGHGIGGYQGGLFYDLTGAYTVSYANAAFAGMLNLVVVGALYFTITRRQAALEAVAQPA